ncbi:hypothetical protein BGP_4578 [Beggiatoa sp. PS]|nr:hypothetical protein BGP_4578 [Beggiatoa sp. PS]
MLYIVIGLWFLSIPANIGYGITGFVRQVVGQSNFVNANLRAIYQ